MPKPAANDGGEPSLSKSQWAYRTVRAMILSGELAPSANLDQQALAAQLGISTTPLREALRRLEAEDYVVRQDHREMRIAPMSLTKLKEIYAIRLELDPLAARLACQNMTTTQVRRVQVLLPPEAGLSTAQYLTGNRDFHRMIYTASGNVSLTKVLEGLWDQCDRYRIGMLENAEMAHRAHSEHSRMCDLLIERDCDGLADLVRAHLRGSLEFCLRDTSRQQPTAPDASVSADGDSSVQVGPLSGRPKAAS
jgi:DNA-binding GntR family transcriptional regulator